VASRPDIAVGAIKTLTGTWVATAGTHSLTAEADPANTLNENSAGRVNNKPANAITFTVAQ
jgi:hypothetical protein